MVRLILLGVLALAMAGYALAAHKRLGLRVEFIPVLLCCAAICVMFLAGLLNLLVPAVWLVTAGGLALLGLGVWRMAREKSFAATLRPFLNPGLIFFVLLVLFFAWRCRGAGLSSIDELKHWALIVKQMDLSGQLPGAYTHYFIFQNYPPASALFIYFVTWFLGFSEARMFMAQLVLVAAGCCCLFAFCPKGARRPAAWLGWALIAAFSLYMSGVVLGIGTLLVDTLLPVLGFAGTAVLLHHRARPGRAAAFCAPVLVANMLTKNSGVFFSAGEYRTACLDYGARMAHAGPAAHAAQLAGACGGRPCALCGAVAVERPRGLHVSQWGAVPPRHAA